MALSRQEERARVRDLFMNAQFDAYFRTELSKTVYSWSALPPLIELRSLFYDLPKERYQQFAVDIYLAIKDSKNIPELGQVLQKAADEWNAKKNGMKPEEFMQTEAIANLNKDVNRLAEEALKNREAIEQLDSKLKNWLKLVESKGDQKNNIEKYGEGFAFLVNAKKNLDYYEPGNEDPSLVLWGIFKNNLAAIRSNSDIAQGKKDLNEEISKLQNLVNPLIELKGSVFSTFRFEGAVKKALTKLAAGIPQEISVEDFKKRAEELRDLQILIDKYPKLSEAIGATAINPEREAAVKKGAQILDQIDLSKKIDDRVVNSVVANVLYVQERNMPDQIKEAIQQAVVAQIAYTREAQAKAVANKILNDIPQLEKLNNETIARKIFEGLKAVENDLTPAMKESAKQSITGRLKVLANREGDFQNLVSQGPEKADRLRQRLNSLEVPSFNAGDVQKLKGIDSQKIEKSLQQIEQKSKLDSEKAATVTAKTQLDAGGSSKSILGRMGAAVRGSIKLSGGKESYAFTQKPKQEESEPSPQRPRAHGSANPERPKSFSAAEVNQSQKENMPKQQEAQQKEEQKVEKTAEKTAEKTERPKLGRHRPGF